MVDIALGNPVWKRYITSRLPEWLLWMRGLHMDSHIHLWERYVEGVSPQVAATRAIKNKEQKKDDEELSMIEKMLIPSDDFWDEMETLAGTPEKITRMYKVSLSGTLEDILYELNPYAESFTEIEKVDDFISRQSAWFSSLMDYLRGYQYNLLIQAGKL